MNCAARVQRPGSSAWLLAFLLSCGVACLLSFAAPGTARAADALGDWRAEIERVRLLAENDAPRAMEATLQLQATMPAGATPADQVRAWNLRTRIEIYLAQTDVAGEHAEMALALAGRHGDRIGQAEADLNIALNAVNQGRLDAVAAATVHSMAMLEGADRPELLGESLLRTAMMYRRRGQIEESVTLTMQAMEIAKRSGVPMALAFAHQGLAISFEQSDRLVEARQHYQQMLEQARAAQSGLVEGYALAGLGAVAVRRGDFAEAERHVQASMQMFETTGTPYNLAFARYALANMRHLQGRPDQALAQLDHALEIYSRYPNRIGLWFVLNKRSSCLQDMGQLGAARTDAERAMAIANELGFTPYKADSASRVAAIAAASGDHRRAYALTQEAADLSAKAARERANTRLVELAQRYETESKQREIAELTRRNERQRHELEQRELQQRWLASVLVGSLLALAAMVYLLRRLKRSQQVLVSTNRTLRQTQDDLQALNTGLEQRINDRTAALRQQARYLRTLIDMLPMWAWFKDTQSRYLVTNRAHAQASGHEVEQMIGRSDSELRPPALAHASLVDDAEVMASGERKTVEHASEDETGTQWMEVYKAAVRDEDGTLLGTVGVARNISERKAAESAREAALAEAERLARLRSDFLAQMSHELRTPLNGILGFAELLQTEANLNDRQQRSLGIIRQSGQHLLNLINDLLDMSRIDAGRLDLYPSPVSLAAYAQAVGDMVHGRAEDKGLQLSIELGPDLPAAVRVDELRLRQVLLNLLANAVKFTDAGQVTLRVARAETGPVSRTRPTVRLRFEVQDSGIGMSLPQLAKLFQPFEQVSEERRRRGGAGLGLAISRQLVRLMGGDIQVDSQPGLGSLFAFEIEVPPCAPPTVAAEERQLVRRPETDVELRRRLGTALPMAKVADERLDALNEAWAVPPLDELRELQRLARVGDMREMMARTGRLQRQQPQYSAFAQHLHDLARDCRSQAVAAFVDHYAMQRVASLAQGGAQATGLPRDGA
ncbi:ATP-binding protein [Aquabacterium sp.]|uniref:ATP-binding protein n=1 Tax=Aquabacterium sp. TaxID=1872578 RepID=UPI002BCF9B2B|nr:ATP-binding protein [Aquabacterium sp.]HSW08312.1 ATP-binding protein [Aquabacterium sp.]